MHRTGPALVVAALIAALGATSAPARTGHASALHRCSVGQRESRTFGPTYVTSLSVSGVTCRTGKSVVRAFHACRKAHGGIRGRCPSTTSVLGFHCSERRGGIKTQFSGRVTCTRGTRRVVHTYTQFT